MINLVVSSFLIVITVLATCGWFVRPICATNALQSLSSPLLLSEKIEEAAKMEFLLDNSSNILTNLTEFNNPLLHNSIPASFDTNLWQLKQTLLAADKITLNDIVLYPVLDRNAKTHNEFRYEINKSNQENNLSHNQKQQTLLLSSIKLVNSSSLLQPLSILSPGATDALITPTNSTSTVSSYSERVDMHESLKSLNNEKLLLHRNKRYLLFPEGSSFQLVFDLIIPIVDYTNFAIMGITCAVAWELPSKPPSEIIENFRTKLNDGTFGLSRRNDTVLQPLLYINSQRTEQQAAKDKKLRRERVTAVHEQHYLPQLSATTATTSGSEHFFTNAQKPPLLQPLSKSNYNNYMQQERIQQPSSYSYGQQPQQPQQQQQGQQWYNDDYETFDANQRKTLYADNNAKKPIHRNNFYSHANKLTYHKDHRQTASKWNFQNWQDKVHQQPPQTKSSYSDKADYWQKENWWKHNKNRIENHWQKSQPKWSKYQDNPQANLPKLMSSRRTARKRKILNKPPKHRIYPIFGKRRRRRCLADHQVYAINNDMAEKLKDIHTKEHLQTRKTLFGKIEKLFKIRGKNGTACVLRALCETERVHLNSHYNRTPQNFVMELLRSMFALPKETLTNSKESLLHIDDHYMKAVLQAHDATQSCKQHYDDCEYSITYDM